MPYLVEAAEGLVEDPRAANLCKVSLHEGFRLAQGVFEREERDRRRLLHLHASLS